MKKQLALVAALLTVVTLPHQSLFAQAAAAHAPHLAEEHDVSAVTAGHAVGDNNHAAVKAVAADKTADTVAHDGVDPAAQAATRGVGLLAANSVPTESLNPFTAATQGISSFFGNIGTTVAGFFGVKSRATANEVATVYTTGTPASADSMKALVKGKSLSFTTQKGTKASAYLKSNIPNKTTQLVIPLVYDPMKGSRLPLIKEDVKIFVTTMAAMIIIADPSHAAKDLLKGHPIRLISNGKVADLILETGKAGPVLTMICDSLSAPPASLVAPLVNAVNVAF